MTREIGSWASCIVSQVRAMSQYNTAKPRQASGRRRARRAGRAGRAGTRHGHAARARVGALGRRAVQHAGERGRRCDMARGPGHDTARPTHDTATRARGLGVPVRAGWAKLVHCAPGSVLTLFFFFKPVFDSVLFLSH